MIICSEDRRGILLLSMVIDLYSTGVLREYIRRERPDRHAIDCTGR